MQAFLVSLGTVALAEIGDRTQLLALVLAARFRRPWPILAGILCASAANHAVAGLIGVWIGHRLAPRTLDIIVGLGMIAMAIWTLKPDKLEESPVPASAAGAFIATLTSFFLAEIGDRTQIATVALAAAYPSLVAVVSGTTLGMLLANAPVVALGKTFAHRLPILALRIGASAVFLALGILNMTRIAWR
ncbi:MAG TPA: TMEM165/GDT1 family protein [Steroidobacteraceae bacterium]|nr:TMEM165/GDT1 family protein [Steroidobacteraceae bacterium]